MLRKRDRQQAADTGASPSSGSYRVIVRTIKVKGEVLRKSLAEVLADPPKFPTLTVPSQNGESNAGPIESKELARGAS